MSSTPPKTAWTSEMVAKSQAARGASVIETKQECARGLGGGPLRLNRRITANTPMDVSGRRPPRTGADPQGVKPLGNINNFSHGVTPWSTYLTCEENFNGFGWTPVLTPPSSRT